MAKSGFVALTNRKRDKQYSEANPLVRMNDEGQLEFRVSEDSGWQRVRHGDDRTYEPTLYDPDALAGTNLFNWNELLAGDTFAASDWLPTFRWNMPSPDPKKGLDEFFKDKGIPRTLAGIQSYQQAYGGLPYRFNADGTMVYDPSAQRNSFSYEGDESFLESGGWIPILAGAALGGGMAGLLPGTTAIGAGAAEAAAASAGGAEIAGGAGGGLGGFDMGASLMQMAQTPSMAVPGIEGISSGALSSILGGAAPVVGGPLGALTLDAAGNIVPQLTNLANSATSLAGGAATVAGGGGLGGGGGGAATTAATTAAKTGLSKFLQDNLGIDVDPSTLGLLGNLLGTGLGVYGANKQAESMEDLYDKFLGLGKPYRDALSQLNANPSSFYSSPIVQGALQQGSDALSRSLSAKVGNPILNPTALQEMQNYTSRGFLDAYNNRWNQLASAGQLGVSQAAPLGVQASNAEGDIGYTAGLGLRSVFGNQNNTAQRIGESFMRQFGLSGLLA